MVGLPFMGVWWGNGDAWEEYARQTFLAHTKNIPPQKLRFLQYIDGKTAGWWAEQRKNGAVLLGNTANALGLTHPRELR